MKYKVSLLFISLLFSFSNLQAQWMQIGDDIDGEAAGDLSGRSVSLSSDGSVVAIGAMGNDGNGNSAGHVRVFENLGGTWTQIGSDIDGEAASDLSGGSVSLSSDGSVVAIGATGNDGNGNSAGHVRVFENLGGTWTQIDNDIDGEDEGDQSGGSVSLSSDGAVVAIGARLNNGNGDWSGHVRIYQNQEGFWTQIGSDIDGETTTDSSGGSVSLNSDGSIVAIGAHSNDGTGSWVGHVRVYQNVGNVWTQIGNDIDGEADYDESGSSVSLNSNGSIVAIGASDNDGNGNNAGHVRIYENLGGVWTQIGDDIDGEGEGDRLGSTVSLSSDGSIMATLKYFNDGNGVVSGQVRVYQNQGNNWLQIGSDIEVEADEIEFDLSLNLSSDGSAVAIGASLNNGNGTTSGYVRIFGNDDLGTSDFSETSISIYPNPTSGALNFDLANNRIQKLSVSDITGKILIEKTAVQQNETIDISNFVNGIYIVNIQIDKKLVTSKIVKK